MTRIDQEVDDYEMFWLCAECREDLQKWENECAAMRRKRNAAYLWFCIAAVVAVVGAIALRSI